MLRRNLLIATASVGMMACQPATEGEPASPECAVIDCDAVGELEEEGPPGWRDKQNNKVVEGDSDWPIEAWTRLPKKMPAPTIENLEGLVVVIFCYQSW